MQSVAVRSLVSSGRQWRPLLYVAGAAVAAGSVYYFYRRRNRQRTTKNNDQGPHVNEAAVTSTPYRVPTPSAPQPPSRPQSRPSSTSLHAPETAADVSPQSLCTASPRAPSVAPDSPLVPQQEPLSSTQSVAEAAATSSPLMSPSLPLPPLELQPVPPSSTQDVPEAAKDATSTQSLHVAPFQAPSPSDPPTEPQPEPAFSIQSAPATAEDVSPLSLRTASPRAPSVAPQSPLVESQEPLSSTQSVPEIAATSSPLMSPSMPLPALELQDEPSSSTQDVSEAAEVATSTQSPPVSPPQAHSPSEPQPEPAFSIQSAPVAVGDPSIPPEAYQVPALYCFLAAKGISNFPLKLSALRQAFCIVLSNSHHLKYLTISGRVLLGGLAARNAREVPAFHQAYNSLVAVAQDASHREAVCTELAQIGIQHFNFIDVVYELVLMGVLQAARPPISPTPGGFLGHLMDMIFSFSPLTTQRRPSAEQYLFLLQDEALLLLESIFSGEEHVYLDPGSLALALWHCVEKHIQQLLLRLQAT